MISKLWQLSLNMLFVKKGRTFFSILAIALGVGLLCSMIQINVLFNQDLQERLEAKYGSADIRISSPTPTNGHEWSGLDATVLEKINDNDDIQAMGRALEGKILNKISYENQKAVIDDADFHYVGVDNEKVTKDYYKFAQDLAAFEVALSENLASQWNVAVADSIEIDLLDGSSVSWKVAEVIQPLSKGEFSENWLYFHLESLQAVMGLEEIFNPILLELDPKADIRFFGYDLERELPREVRVDALYGLEETEEAYTFFHIYGYILSIIALMASVMLVYSLMQTTYRERLKELAIIRAVGGSTKQLLEMVIYEWAFIGAIGSLLGFIVARLFSGHGILWIAKLIHLDIAIEPQATGSIGMIVTAFVSWIVILLASIGIVKRVIETDPIQSFRESLDHDQETEERKLAWWIIMAVAGILLWLIAYLIRAEESGSIPLMNLKALMSLTGGLALSIALFSRVVWLGVALLRLINLLPNWLASRSLKLSAQRLIIEKSQLSTVILMALVITVFIPVVTLFLFVESSTSVDRSKNLDADFFVHAEQEFYLTPTSEMPWYIKHEIDAIEGVEQVLPLPAFQTAKINEKDNLDDSTDKDVFLHYFTADVRTLADWNVVSLPEDVLENAGFLSLETAEELGIDIGDTISLIINREPIEIVIVDITEQLDGLPQHANALIINENHPAIQPSNVGEIYIRMKAGYKEQVQQSLSLLEREYPEMRWGYKSEAISSFETMRQQILIMLAGLAVIIIAGATGGVLNGINAGIHASRREYAVLRSVFLTPFHMVKMVVWQGVILSILSITIGTATALCLMFSIYNASSGFNMIFKNAPLGVVGILYLIIFIMTVLASLPMAGKIARMKIMDLYRAAE